MKDEFRREVAAFETGQKGGVVQEWHAGRSGEIAAFLFRQWMIHSQQLGRGQAPCPAFQQAAADEAGGAGNGDRGKWGVTVGGHATDSRLRKVMNGTVAPTLQRHFQLSEPGMQDEGVDFLDASCYGAGDNDLMVRFALGGAPGFTHDGDGC